MSVRLTLPPERDFPMGRLQQRKEQLVSQIAADTAAPRRLKRRPRRVLVVAVTFAAAGVLAAAAYGAYVLTQPATQLASIGCYESDSLDANTAVLSPGIASPVATCAGTYASAFPTAQPPTSFVACVLPSGSVGVFPADNGTETCKSLGLSELAQTHATQQEAQQFTNLQHELAGIFAGNTCLSYDDARTRARAALVDSGLTTWKIQIGEGVNGEGFSSQRPCAGLAYDTSQQTIILVPEATH